jgi:hypothetical protein
VTGRREASAKVSDEKALEAVEHEIAGERAGAIARSGRKLRVALDNLQRFDERVGGHARLADPAGRAKLVEVAADAFWSYIVQREAMGLVDSDYIRHEYGVPHEVWRRGRPR